MAPVKTVILVIGLGVLGYILKDTFVPLPAAPFSWDALAAGITLAAGVVLPFVYPPVRRGIANSPLLKAGAGALLGTSGPQVTGELAPSANRPAKPRRRSPPGQQTG
jgi:hypothetical protein